jgi:predicted ATP-binding protein involved in virulence
MQINTLAINNFRGFKELTLKLPPNLAVIIGVNGSGKSSILDCISILSTHILTKVVEEIYNHRANTSQEKAYYPKFELSDINSQAIKIEISLELLLQNDKRPSVDQSEEFIVRPSLEFNKIGFSGELYRDSSKEFADFIFGNLQIDINANIPIYVHYKTDRSVFDVFVGATKLEQIPFSQISAYKGCTATNQNNFRDFFEWFRNQEDIENENLRYGEHAYQDRQLGAVKTAITSILDGFTDLRIKRLFLEMTVKKHGQELIINQLSDGEKVMLAMVGDMARRLAIANPSLSNPLEGKGIVLIDEIELHLHPQWQRRIIPELTKTFPNCQFILTTHSPQVLSNVRKENVFILEDFKLVKSTPYTYGRDSNSILFELMNVTKRPDETQKLIDECFYLIDEGNVEDAKLKLQDLSNLMGEHDSEIVEANALIKFFHSDQLSMSESNEANN